MAIKTHNAADECNWKSAVNVNGIQRQKFF